MDRERTLFVGLLFLFPTLSGCLGVSLDDEDVLSDSLNISPSVLTAADFQMVDFTAEKPMSVFVPYLVVNPISGYIQNGTVLDFSSNWDSISIDILVPPNNEKAIFLVGELGRNNWPLRATNESWDEWILRGATNQGSNNSNAAIRYSDNSTFLSTRPQQMNTIDVGYVEVPVSRPFRDDLTVEQGTKHSVGLVDGYSVLEEMIKITDEDTGYNDRWGPFSPNDPAYEDALSYIASKFMSYGLDAEIHRYRDSSSPYAVNVCGYKTGTLFPDEWLVLGAHLDVAEPGGSIGSGTRIGAHDNTAGVVMSMFVAQALAQLDHRRTMVVCFWSNEENGYDGVDRWIDNIPPGVTITNYLNIDSAGVNYPGDYTLVVDIIPETDNEINEQIEMVGLTEWIGSTNNDIAEVLRNGREMYYNESEGYAAMKDHSHKHPNTISVHESQRGRSDYIRFADRLGVVSLDFGAITGGYDCYHELCDTVDEMIAWMGTDNATGTENLVASFDMICWWQFSLFLYLDERPVYDGS